MGGVGKRCRLVGRWKQHSVLVDKVQNDVRVHHRVLDLLIKLYPRAGIFKILLDLIRILSAVAVSTVLKTSGLTELGIQN